MVVLFEMLLTTKKCWLIEINFSVDILEMLMDILLMYIKNLLSQTPHCTKIYFECMCSLHSKFLGHVSLIFGMKHLYGMKNLNC